MEEKKNTGLVVAIIFLVVCVLGLGGYIVYDKVIKKEPEKTPDTQTSPNVVEKEPTMAKNIISLNVENVGKRLFEKINIKDSDGSSDGIYVSNQASEYAFFYNDDLSYNNMNKKLMLHVAFNNLTLNDIDFTTAECVDDSDSICSAVGVEYSKFKKAYNDVFGYDKSVDFTNFVSNLMSCSLKNDYIICVSMNGGNAWEKFAEITYNGASLVGDDIVLKVTKSYVDLNNTKSDTKNFEVTFKKDSTDNWYWYSTKLAK